MPIGFKNSLLNLLKKNFKDELGIEITGKIKDLRKAKSFDISKIDLNAVIRTNNIKLRDYQHEAITAFFKSGCIGLIEGSVASGKTFMFAVITKIINEPTLIVMGRKDLVHNGMEEFVKEYGFNPNDIGIVQGQNYDEKRITFCTIQSFEKIQNIDQYKFIVIDEVHHCSSETYQRLLMSSQAPYRLGVSGTISGLEMVEVLKVKSFMGDIVYKIETKELIKRGFLAEPTVYGFEIEEPDINPADFGSNWIKIETDLIVNNEARNNIIARLANEGKLPTPLLILVRRIPHGELLQSLIPGSVFLQGKSKDEDRKKFRQLMDKGDDVKVIATDIFNEGVNMKELKVVVIAGAMKSHVLIKQRAGRGLRKTETKKTITLIDFIDRFHRIPERQSEARFRQYKKDGFIIKDGKELLK